MKITIFSALNGQILRTAMVPVGMASMQLNGPDEDWIEGEYPDDRYYINGLTPVAISAKPSDHHRFNYATKQWEDPRTLADLKAAKNAAINAARERAELSGFSHAGKWFQSATLDQRNIDKVAWHIARHNAFPADFPGAWKAADNTWLPMPAVADFDAFMNSLIARGVELFAHAQALKAQLAAATTAEEVAAVPDW